jgi:hypothetical protein
MYPVLFQWLLSTQNFKIYMHYEYDGVFYPSLMPD